MAQFTDAMIDIETTGLGAEQNNIIQIAAVKFNLETGEVSDDLFDRCLAPAGHRSWDPSTASWWQSKAALLNELMLRAEPINEVLVDLQAWSLRNAAGPLRFWCKPLSFDFPFIQSYYRDAGLAMPFHYRDARDVNTYISAIHGGSAKTRYLEVPFSGIEHNAVYDALHQVKLLFAARKEAGFV